MSNLPLVSIIVLNWNGEKCIQLCLNSLFEQTYPNYEVIVVDNASTDDSPEIVRREFSRARLIVNGSNLGFAAGNNVGIRAANGDLIAMFNNDAIADKDWLAEMVKALTSSHQVGVVGSLVYYYEPKDRIWSAGARLDALTGLMWQVPQDESPEKVNSVKDDIDLVANCASLIKKETFDKVGLLDEDYFFLVEDLDWCVTAKRVGYECKTVTSAIIYHMVGQVTKDIPLFRVYHHFRGIFHFSIKHLPFYLLLSVLFSQLFVTTIVGTLTFKQGPRYTLAKMRGLFWNLSHLRHILRERRETKALGKMKYRVRLGELMSFTRKWLANRTG